MKKYLLFFAGMLGWLMAQAQPSLTLEQCYTAARENHPLLKQKELARQTGELTISNLERNRWLLNWQSTARPHGNQK